MIIIYWYYLGSDNDVETNLIRIINKIKKFNDNDQDKYTVTINNIYINKRKKYKYWLQLEVPYKIKKFDIKFNKYIKRLFTMDKFLEYRKYHNKWYYWTTV